MELTIEPQLLTPSERSSIVQEVEGAVATVPCFTAHGYRLLSAVAFPYTGPGLWAVQVDVIVDRSPYAHADLGDGPERAFPEPSWKSGSKTIQVNFLTTAQAITAERFSVGPPVLGEPLVVDPHLERAFQVLAAQSQFSPAFLSMVMDMRPFIGAAHNRLWARPQSLAGVQRLVTLALVLPDQDQTALYRQIDHTGLLQSSLGRAAELGRAIDAIAAPVKARAWAAQRLGTTLPLFKESIYSKPFRQARMVALESLGETVRLDYEAAGTNVLLARGGTRPIVPSVWSSLVSQLSNRGGPAHAETESEEFLL